MHQRERQQLELQAAKMAALEAEEKGRNKFWLYIAAGGQGTEKVNKTEKLPKPKRKRVRKAVKKEEPIILD